AAGFSISTGAFRSAAQIYAPLRAVAEADAPARLVIPGLVPLDLNWKGMRASARLAWPLPERVSVEATEVRAVADVASPAGPLAFVATSLQFHMRPAEPDIDLAIRFENLEPGSILLAGG